jgi:hypothetical protein
MSRIGDATIGLSPDTQLTSLGAPASHRHSPPRRAARVSRLLGISRSPSTCVIVGQAELALKRVGCQGGPSAGKASRAVAHVRDGAGHPRQALGPRP